ncbi:hypothetical protein NIA71_13535 [Ihubacter massiliensis]|uniref:Uncharacterized protein n=1 Tax=Hominibacterium faecale TaxID=2839743 RepID=A0A9J6QP76_9FIRM|nr:MULTISPECIES: hypothetical protein [Eubacteriales Family XIII. Incertae Sedis]MCO7122967.1 hypothetical protein [Ihubacter massiliensis]MCU7377228.1 hypothetical protein [Hominibacterium faecale]
MKRKCLFLVIALVLVFGSVSVVSAYSWSATVNANRTSNTSARVSADITYTTTVDSATNKITLQEKYNGSWRTATGVPVKTVSRTKSNVRSLSLPYTFTLVKGKVYRAKADFTSKKGSSTITKTFYSNVF